MQKNYDFYVKYDAVMAITLAIAME